MIAPNQLVVLASKSRQLARMAMSLGECRHGSIVATYPVQRLFLQGARPWLTHPLRTYLLDICHVGAVAGLFIRHEALAILAHPRIEDELVLLFPVGVSILLRDSQLRRPICLCSATDGGDARLGTVLLQADGHGVLIGPAEDVVWLV